MQTWKISTNGLINEKCNLTLIQINKQMKLFFLGSLFHVTYLILPLNLMKKLLPNVIIRNI